MNKKFKLDLQLFSEPTEPTEPAEPTEPTEPTEPAEPTEKTDWQKYLEKQDKIIENQNKIIGNLTKMIEGQEPNDGDLFNKYSRYGKDGK